MSDILQKLQSVKDKRAKVQARLDVNRERLAVIDKELGEYGVTSETDLAELEKVLEKKLAEFDLALTKVEEAIKNYDDRRSTDD